MANIIKPKRSSVAGKVPTTTDLVSGELGVNMTDQKTYINNGTSVVQVGAGNLSGLGDVVVSSPTNGQSLKYNSSTSKWENSTAGAGDVVGPTTATDNAITRFDGTTGKLIQGSTATIDDNGNFGNVNAIAFDTTPATTPTAAGAMFWDNGNGTPSVVLDADVTLQLGQENIVRVYNGSGATINNGQVVAVSGAQGQRPSVVLADADSEPLSAATLGIATENIANGAEGFVTTFGLIRGINTSAFTAGAPIYLSSTAGAFTATRPTAPAHTVFLGWVVHVNASSGEVFVNISNGWELDELHNVLITSPASGNTLVYDATAGVWKNASLTAGTGISVTNGAGSITIANTGVTSVTGTSPVNSSGGATPAISLASGYGDTQNPYASKTANTFLAAPNGTAGVPSFRAIVAADIPTLNQNTTGTASNVTGTVAVANGGTGQTTYTNGQLLIGNSTGNTLAKATLTQGTGISITNGAGSITIANSAPDQTVSLTGSGATTVTGTYPNFTISSTNTTYSLATSTVAGLIELASDTAQTTAANAVTSTANRTYGLQLNASGQGVVNVPWTDTVYSLPAATATVRGGIELGSDTTQTVAANAVTATASRTYALQVNADGQGVVNVPWTDTNSGGTVTSVGGTGTVSGLTLSGTVTTSGNLTLGGTLSVTPSNFASQTANTVLAAPNGTAGTPTFRALVAADIPTLNQNTTGTASNVTGTVAIANGGTGQTTRQAALNALAGATTSAQFLRGNGTNVVMSAIQASDVPTLNQNTTGTASNVTGTVAVANGGTGATTATGALTNLGALASTNPSYTGTLTGGTGIINIGSNQFYKDTNGNIGIGGVPSGWGTAYKAIQGSTDLTLMAQDEIRTGANCFYDGTNWKFISSGYASLIGTNKTNGAFSYGVTSASGTAGTNATISTRFYVDGARASIAGPLRVNSLSAPEGDIDFTVGSDVRWLGRAGRLDCVNNANTAWQSGVFRGANIFFRTADDTTRFAVYNDGRAYLQGNSASRGGNGYILSVRDDSLAEPLRMGGYIEWFSNVGAIGTYYFNSDQRLKKNIAPTAKTAREAIDAIEFKQFDWNEFTDQDGEHVDLGVIAQQLQQINPKFVNVMSDSTLGVNEPELVTYALKAIQELSAELAAVKQELAQLKGIA